MLTRNWSDYPILRFSQLLKVQVELINRPELPSLGEGAHGHGPTVTAIAFAFAFAFAHASGKRLRDLPMTAERLKKFLV
ncbi:Nicotinate dehydrogenase subunit B [Polaromonas vacuolata]|uniref:Nicotinate dehydrogenase subunit B n=1 Tax=Polaromonas vacuolata TaxID=37448 RepID=A0A6H2H8S8_9BURK|nr:xanthine dehydrogenase family protein molybdopterin-binding subunit [Polaromonas vacuolata]QJC56177.1 Nicotinate dehydrogenase subunit B [Polaromonas vacuolata]